MQSLAQLASQNVPFFLETGQNLASQVAGDPRFQAPDADLTGLLKERIQSVPFFNQFVIVDLTTGSVLACLPGRAGL